MSNHYNPDAQPGFEHFYIGAQMFFDKETVETVGRGR